jgi:aspartyl-tRNA(Asn)/glutamyl-tRNA(Gln) amidotransferase subunit C
MLARLGLSDREVETFREQLVQVLDYIAMLDKVDTSRVPPTAQILSHLNVLRADASRPSWPVEELLANAPGAEGEMFRVPAVLEETAGGAPGGASGGDNG